MEHTKYFNLVSLGCPKNRVDSERILSTMVAAGFVFTDEVSEAHVLVVNTCAFIEPAVAESIDTILDYRSENTDAILVVAGCLPMRYGEELRASLPEVDLFVNPEQIRAMPELLDTVDRLGPRRIGSVHAYTPLPVNSRILTTPGYAYLRIAEGCARSCRYCTIPTIRGPLRSEDLQELEQEALTLVSQGVRELVLVAQDLTAYGRERGEPNALIHLLERLSSVRGVRWLRLMYLHPDGIPKDLARVINESGNILPYLDIPFQHVSQAVLKAMGRPWKGDRVRKTVDRLREQVPDLVLRTTLMVGFPAEGESEFAELRDFVVEYAIEHVGVFTYSPEEGTPAMVLGDPVPEETKKARAEELQGIHRAFQDRRNRARVGRLEPCIVEGVSDETPLLLQGRTWDQAPEVDGVLYITAGTASVGEIRNVVITDWHGSDLFGEIMEPAESHTEP